MKKELNVNYEAAKKEINYLASMIKGQSAISNKDDNANDDKTFNIFSLK
jgi:hypothetical protein